MHDASGEAVILGLGTARLVPADMGGVQSNRYRAEPHVEAAHCTAVFIRLQHFLAEDRGALPAGDGRFKGKANRLQDILVERFWEMMLEDALGDFAGQMRVRRKSRPHVVA